MKKNILITRTSQTEVLATLLTQHIELKRIVDVMFSKAWDTNSIEPLMEIRSLNSKCISKYNDLISNQELTIEKAERRLSIGHTFFDVNLDLWKINEQLSRLIPLYQSLLSEPNISSFVRMLISINYEKLVLVRDNLLHPVPEVLTA